MHPQTIHKVLRRAHVEKKTYILTVSLAKNKGKMISLMTLIYFRNNVTVYACLPMRVCDTRHIVPI